MIWYIIFEIPFIQHDLSYAYSFLNISLILVGIYSFFLLILPKYWFNLTIWIFWCYFTLRFMKDVLCLLMNNILVICLSIYCLLIYLPIWYEIKFIKAKNRFIYLKMSIDRCLYFISSKTYTDIQWTPKHNDYIFIEVFFNNLSVFVSTKLNHKELTKLC